MISDFAIQSFITVPEFIQRNIGWYIFGTILVLGLFVLGLSDVLRFSIKRVWAISSVNFAESIRRRVLWITPLAILAIIIISQLQKPIDAQDAIRQTTKVALFTTATLVMLVSIILACTNLPKEIENRVIFTVVTKPATRLEIILGKVLGFSRITAAILLIMGLFTWGYLHARAWGLERQLRAQLAEGVVAEVNRPTYEHYATAGLVQAKRVQRPRVMNIFSRLPQPEDTHRWVVAGMQEIRVPIHARAEDLNPPGAMAPVNGLMLLMEMDYVQRALTDEEMWEEGLDPVEDMAVEPLGPGIMPQAEQEPPVQRRPAPRLQISILDHNGFTLVASGALNDGLLAELPPQGSDGEVRVFIPPASATIVANHLRSYGLMYLQILPMTAGVEYGLAMRPQRTGLPASVALLVPGSDQWILPRYEPEFRGRPGRWGQHVRGGAPEDEGMTMALFRFRDAAVAPGADGMVPMEMPRVGVERSFDDIGEVDQPTTVSIQIRRWSADEAGNYTADPLTEPILVTPENNRPTHFLVPAAAVAGGSFDVIVRCITPGHFIGVREESLVMVAGQHSFAFNLVKSLSILWLLSVLVIIVSIFSSTFLSWPIAVVLTSVILMGHYAVERLADEAPGLGARVATDLGFQDPAQARVVSESVELLNRGMHLVGAVLPDISRFAAVEEIERGLNIPALRLADSFRVAFGFGIPMMVLGYVLLRNKEVAP